MPAIHPKLYKYIYVVIIALVGFTACKYRGNGPGRGEKPLISFKSIEGITFIEVARKQKNGLTFNEYGFHLSPEWRLRFVSEDSAALYSPVKKEFLNFPLALGTDSVFNTGRVFLRVKKMNRDSLLLDLLEAKEDSMNINKSRVSMLFYSEDHIKKLGTDTATPHKASKQDSAFIKSLAAKANTNIKKAFAAQHPVQIISKSPHVAVEKFKNKPSSLDNHFSTTDDYLDPNFTITIRNALSDFEYYFSAYVDAGGKMHFRRALVEFLGDKDFENAYIRQATGVMDSYLVYYTKVIPGETLGIKHASIITLRVKGIAKKAK